MTLKGKLLTGFLSSTALVLILAIIGYIQISQLNNGLTESKHHTISNVSKDIEAIKTANKIAALSQKIRFASNSDDLKTINLATETEDALKGAKELDIDAELVKNQFELLHQSRIKYFEIREKLPQEIESIKRDSERFVQETLVALVELEENALNRASNSSLNTIKKERLKLAKTAKIAQLQADNIPDFSDAFEAIQSMQFSLNSIDNERPLDEFKETTKTALTTVNTTKNYFAENYSSLHKQLVPYFETITESLNQVIDFQPILTLSEPVLTVVDTETDATAPSQPVAPRTPPASKPSFDRASLAAQINEISSTLLNYTHSKNQKSVGLITKSVQRIHNSLSKETTSNNSAISNNYAVIAQARDDFNNISINMSEILSQAHHVLSSATNNSFQQYSDRLANHFLELSTLKKNLNTSLQEATGSTEMGTQLDEQINTLLLAIVDDNGVTNQLDQLTKKSNSMKDSENQILQTLEKLNQESILRSKHLASSLATQLDTGIEKANSTKNWIIYTCIAVMLLSATIGVELPRRISNKLNNMSETMGEVSRSLSVAAEQVLSTSTQLADGASNQAASLEETTASVQEIRARSEENALNANQTSEVTLNAKQSASSSVAHMKAMEQAMKGIQHSSSEISDIIKTIEEIAFQTNILALNAAVEAARAGEAGSGFAVVADEVRSLAQRASQAAQNTSEKIAHAISNAQQGVDISEKAKLSLEEISGHTDEAERYVANIKESVGHESESIIQISTAMLQLDEVTQATAASANDSADAARVLDKQADQLLSSVAELQVILNGRTKDTAVANKDKADKVDSNDTWSQSDLKRESTPNHIETETFFN